MAAIEPSWGHSGGGWAIAVHGGAGAVPHERRAEHQAGCARAAEIGAEILRKKGSALDAVQAAVACLEDNPAFNAGTGGSLNSDGHLELDASIMEGAELRAGAVCALPPYLHPIAIARAVLDARRHVLYAGAGADKFARASGFSPSSEAVMVTAAARAQLHEVVDGRASAGWAGGTVGAVARDAHGVVAAATSTGGTMGKDPGRVGDSPLIGAGTYADNAAGACSNTGDGEAAIKLVLAKTAIDWLRDGMLPQAAAEMAVRQLGERMGAKGGIILVDYDGRIGLARNTETMSWAAASETLERIASGIV
jgi:beta-aspartyl-peptidase (threonine type)